MNRQTKRLYTIPLSSLSVAFNTYQQLLENLREDSFHDWVRLSHSILACSVAFVLFSIAQLCFLHQLLPQLQVAKYHMYQHYNFDYCLPEKFLVISLFCLWLQACFPKGYIIRTPNCLQYSARFLPYIILALHSGCSCSKICGHWHSETV